VVPLEDISLFLDELGHVPQILRVHILEILFLQLELLRIVRLP